MRRGKKRSDKALTAYTAESVRVYLAWAADEEF